MSGIKRSKNEWLVIDIKKFLTFREINYSALSGLPCAASSIAQMFSTSRKNVSLLAQSRNVRFLQS